jgi:hypothetical protein
MSKLVDNSISIYEAMQNINNGKYVMPAFQRQYVWSMEKIEKLWDSILQGYPISTFLFWHISDDNVSWDTYFCDFMKEVRFDSTKKADDINYELRSVDLSITDTAVLDGQQRLTSLYISLFGSTGIRPKNQRRNNSAQVLTKLLIELNKNKIDVQDEFNIKKYDIRFTDKVGKVEPTQFEIKNILKPEFKDKDKRALAIENAIRFVPQDSKDYAKQILNEICVKVYEESLIRYTEIFDMSQDDALEMFVRFNSGGITLKKSEITMSILEAYWPNAKTQFGMLLKGDYENFDTDFVIRSAHMIYGNVVKSNISKQVATDLKNNWQDFTKAFKNTANILKKLKISPSRFTNSWNVLVPIIFCVYYNPNYEQCIDGIKSYLYRAIFFTYYKSGTTGKLQKIKDCIISYDYEITSEMLDQISELRVTDAKVEELLNSEKGSRVAGEILYYLSLDWLKDGPKYEQDHLHPEERFNKAQPTGISMEKWAEWRKLYNRLPNLQYLEGRPNASKQDMSLREYYDDMNESQQAEFKKNAFIPNDVSFDLINFEDFYYKRKELLRKEIFKKLS